MSAPPSPPAPRPRRRRWLFVPLTLVVLMLVVLLWAYVRGTSSDPVARNPARPSDPPVSQLYRTADGHTTVRAAVLVSQPRQKVWDVVTDFDHYGDVLQAYMRDVTAERQPDGTKLVKGEAKSTFAGYWKFELTAHEDKGDRAGPVVLGGAADRSWREWGL